MEYKYLIVYMFSESGNTRIQNGHLVRTEKITSSAIPDIMQTISDQVHPDDGICILNIIPLDE